MYLVYQNGYMESEIYPLAICDTIDKSKEIIELSLRNREEVTKKSESVDDTTIYLLYECFFQSGKNRYSNLITFGIRETELNVLIDF